jgi:DNA polymerase III delta' subunit
VRLQLPLGQGEALAYWQRRARSLLLPHAMVVEGARGIGKTTVMRWLTAALLCPSELDADGPCGVCRACTRVASDLHPDVHLVERARDEKDAEENDKSFYVIKVDQVRQAQQALSLHAVEGRARVLRIADADSMEEEAQNALLKTLEEPGVATFLLLEARRPEQLLPTVRSRVQRLRVRPLDDAALARGLSEKLPNQGPRLPDALSLAHGSLGLAELACTERAVQLHDLVRALLAGNKGLRPVAIARAVLEGKRNLRQDMARGANVPLVVAVRAAPAPRHPCQRGPTFLPFFACGTLYHMARTHLGCRTGSRFADPGRAGADRLPGRLHGELTRVVFEVSLGRARVSGHSAVAQGRFQIGR